jgi:LDH2 family malate/lactate/ureidoglycolate dehydrogenase
MRIAVDDLRSLVSEIFSRRGLSRRHAWTCADALVEAEARGIQSHGVQHVPNLVQRIDLGLINTRPRIRATTRTDSTLLIDGDNGPGPVVAMAALEQGVPVAEALGVAVVAVRRSNHFGIGAYFAEAGAAHRLITIVASNAAPVLGADGHAGRIIGTNPLAIAIPDRNGHPAISFDMGMGMMPLGRVRQLYERDKPLPPGVGLDGAGSPTVDPAAVLAGGSINPVGGYRGFGLAIVIEVLAGVLAGAATRSEIGSLFVDYDRPQGTGHFMVLINPATVAPQDAFYGRLDTFIAGLKDARGAPIQLPGMRSKAKGVTSRQEGLIIGERTYEQLMALWRQLMPS